MRLLKKIIAKIKTFFRAERYLCDTCKYDYGDVCKRPERPNATECDDYKSRFK